MIKTALRYGLYSISVSLVVMVLVYFLLKGQQNFTLQEIAGYVSIVLSLLFIYFGMRHYRDAVNNGTLEFNQGLKLGLLITLFPALLFGLYSALYISYINPAFVDQYMATNIEKLREALPPEEFAAKKQELETFKTLYSHPGIQFVVMFLTVFAIGVVITVLSTLILRRKASTN